MRFLHWAFDPFIMTRGEFRDMTSAWRREKRRKHVVRN